MPVFFNAQLGGLQSHVIAQVKALSNTGHHCTVMCKPGPFAGMLREYGVQVITTNFESVDSDVELALDAAPFDLVHAHPFASRKVGHAVAKRLNTPFLITFHGTYLDDLNSYARDVDVLIAVSHAIRDTIVRSSSFPAERIIVLPNGVDTEVFYRRKSDWTHLVETFPVLSDVRPQDNDRRIFLATRMDQDKRFILDVVKDAWNSIKKTKAFDLIWFVAGEGTQRAELEDAAHEVNIAAGRKLISFLGWQKEPSLAALFSSCHLAIAPGRSALEAMACGTPVIALGSKGYAGLIQGAQALKGLYGNFGGFGDKNAAYEPGAMFSDIDAVIYDGAALARIGAGSLTLANAFFQQRELDETLLRVYSLAPFLHSGRARGQVKHPAPCPKIAFYDPAAPDRLSQAWARPRSEGRFALSVSPEGSLTVDYTLREDDKFYLATSSSDFSRPPRDVENWSLDPDRTYEVAVAGHITKGTPKAQLWIIEYSAEERLRHTTLLLQEGNNEIEFTTSPRTVCFKAALRFSGKGTISVGPFVISQFEVVRSAAGKGKSMPAEQRAAWNTIRSDQ